MSETVSRYLMPLLPAMILLVTYTLFSITKNKYINFGFIILILFSCFQSYGLGEGIIHSKEYSYTGHKGAGEWMEKNIEKNAIVFTGSHTSTRFFLRNHLVDSATQTKTLLGNLTELAKEAEKYNSNNIPVYVQIDAWEYTQPSWAYPFFNQEFGGKIKKIEENNFTIATGIEKELPTEQGLMKNSVVLIFKYEHNIK